MTIATRAAAAKPEETAGLLDELFFAIHGSKPERVPGGSQDWLDWLDQRIPFGSIIRINTPESLLAAAMMLVPEGWQYCITSHHGCWIRESDHFPTITGFGETPALALIAAIAQSKGL
jgi:hypothetical protein